MSSDKAARGPEESVRKCLSPKPCFSFNYPSIKYVIRYEYDRRV